MIIRTQDESAIYDTEKAFSIFTNEDNEVMALGYTGELAYKLGEYKTHDRAKEVVEEIYAFYDSQSKYDMPVV